MSLFNPTYIFEAFILQIYLLTTLASICKCTDLINTSNEECIYTFNSKSSRTGNFSSPALPSAYPADSVHCIYNFKGEPFQAINITFITFDLEKPFPNGCLTDSVDISTISNFNVKRLIGRFCGNKVPSPIISLHPRTEIIFKSNRILDHKGFHGIFQFIDESKIGLPSSDKYDHGGCGGKETGTAGILRSPNYPSTFPKSVDCLWLIRVEPHQHIYVQLTQLQLIGNKDNCNEAFLAIYDGYENYDFETEETKKFCGQITYYKMNDDKVILSPKNRLLIRFKSEITNINWNKEAKSQELIGFELTWTAISFKLKGECNEFLCEKSEFCLNPKNNYNCPQTHFFCIDKSLQCNGLPNCSEQDNSDEYKCTIPLFIGGSTALAFFIFTIILWCCCKRRQKFHKKYQFKNISSTTAFHCNNNSNDGSMQLRHLEKSPSFTISRPDSLDFFLPRPPSSSSQLTMDDQESLDAINNCSIHGPIDSKYLTDPTIDSTYVKRFDYNPTV